LTDGNDEMMAVGLQSVTDETVWQFWQRAVAASA
jgi:hypothetical protein